MEVENEKTVKIDSKQKRRRKKINKKAVISILIVVVLILLITIFMTNRNKKSNYKYIETENVAEVLKDSTNSEQEQIKLSEIKIESIGATMTAKAKLTNSGSKINKAEVNLYLYDEDNNLRGQGTTVIENIEQNGELDVSTSVLGSYTDLSRYEIKIEKVER